MTRWLPILGFLMLSCSACADQVVPLLTIEEYRICAKDVAKPDRFEYARRIPASALDKRRSWREVRSAQPSFSGDLSDAIPQLKSFGCTLVKTNHGAKYEQYELRKNGKIVLSHISNMDRFLIDGTGKHFALVAYVEKDRSYEFVLCVDGKVQCRGGRSLAVAFVGADVMSIWATGYRQGAIMDCAVKRGSETVYTFSTVESPTDDPIRVLMPATLGGDGWVLEYDNHLVVSGVDIGKAKGYRRIFSYNRVRGKDLYFVEKDGKIRICYGGRLMPQVYDDVVHYQCCEPGMYNVRGNEHMVCFHALKDGYWYYVEAGIYK